MKSYSAYRKVGLLLCAVLFACMVFLLKNNLQQIVAEHKVQEQKLAQEKKQQEEQERQEQEREHQRQAAAARESSSGRGGGEGSVVEASPTPRPETSPSAVPSVGPVDSAENLPPVPSGFRRINESDAGVSFNLPELWTRTESTNPKGERYLTYTSPDGEATIIFWCKLDPENAFVPTTEGNIRALAQQNGYSITSVQGTLIGGEKCVRWGYNDGRTLSINRLFRHGDKSYSLLYRLPEAKFPEWEAKLDEVRTSFRFVSPVSSE